LSYYLLHHFDEKRDHLHLKPLRKAKTGNAVLFDMGYVQNVIKGQLLARFIPLKDAIDPHPGCIFDEPKLPIGDNTHIDPTHPMFLLASVNGYVFYYKKLITVKRTLNVRGDVDFKTGNIFFVGDTVVHGGIRAGFEVQSNNIIIQDIVEGSIVRARQDIAAKGGIRGGAGGHCILSAGGNLTAPYVERVEIRAELSILIDKYCMHATVYCGGNFALKGRLVGGTINVNSNAYVGEQIGNKAAIPTKIFLGYNPMRIRVLNKIDTQIRILSESLIHLNAIAGHLPEDANIDARRKLTQKSNQYNCLVSRRTTLWRTLHKDELNTSKCQLVVPGCVHPGVEIAIGRSYLEVDRKYENVIFRLVDDEIIIESLKSYSKLK